MASTTDDAATVAKLNALTSLAAEHTELPYSAIAAALKVDESEVETWVIRAISAKLIEAKMNQLKRTVVISHFTPHEFTMAQWKQLGARLAAWRENIHALRGVLQTTLQQHQQEKLGVAQ
eukprot:gnl/Hemi2/18339_TR6077_c1_g1_i1.p2 gnl/Hemi2/18339_TR6077_c1_g1~~gnl/Hemi2/18339_TR6077_c1_g1_i1.p2  ORF type:complete len:120 (+),score=37.68 gnl/Hemi2/18339_TR6077_c1_g1_i1:77-436(+)